MPSEACVTLSPRIICGKQPRKGIMDKTMRVDWLLFWFLPWLSIKAYPTYIHPICRLTPGHTGKCYDEKYDIIGHEDWVDNP